MAYTSRYNNGKIRTSYINGNAARKLSAVPDIPDDEIIKKPKTHTRPQRHPQIRPQQRPQTQIRRQPRGMQCISFTSLLVLAAASIATVYLCIEFLKLQYEVTAMDKSIISMEKQLTALINENDAAFEAINTAFDLDYVYRVAVEELGMVYPKDNKVIKYKSSGTDYVRQYEDME